MEERRYVAIDLKSFYASVECVERGLDPLDANLVVADITRTEKTICLAVSPSLKAYGVPGRPRLFEVIQRAEGVNRDRRRAAGGAFSGKSVYRHELDADKTLELDFLTARPRMSLYMDYSVRIYNIYRRYVSPEDIHVYSIDEVFMDVTDYLKLNGMTAEEMTRRMIRDVLSETGITATAGIGTNLYLCKIAMDITAKHSEADEYGVRIAELNERKYREQLWDHRPITDFWRVGRGIAKKLAEHGMYTMGDIARCSAAEHTYPNEELLYDLFGVNAELLIDHAWGYEPCRMSDIKGYTPETHSISAGQVLSEPYDHEKAKLIVREMTDGLALELVKKGLVSSQAGLMVGYDSENITNAEISTGYRGKKDTDRYGKTVPKEAHGSVNFGSHTASSRIIIGAVMELFEKITDRALLIRRITISMNDTLPEDEVSAEKEGPEQLDMFTDYGQRAEEKESEARELAKEKKLQRALLGIKDKYGRNSILRGTSYEDGATARERNGQIGGHRA